MSADIPKIPIKEFKTFEGRCKHLYKIQDKSGTIVPFEFIQAQKILDNVIEEEFVRTKQEYGVSQCRLIIVKPRQIGATTYTSIRSFDMQNKHSGSNGRIMAHDQDTTDLIYEIYTRLYEHLPEYAILTDDDGSPIHKDRHGQPIPIKVKLATRSYSGKRLALENNTRTVISTAGKGDAGGKGTTELRIHATEAANYQYYDDIMTSLLPSIPKGVDNVLAVLESTANGVSGDGEGFYKEWIASVREWEKYKNGEKNRFFGFRPVFIPWYMIEEYELSMAGGQMEDLQGVEFDSPDIRRAYLQREEKMMNEGIINPLTGETTVISPEKINWYRAIAIKTDAKGNYARAQRYYPTTPEDAFVASSNSFFDVYELSEHKKSLINDPPSEQIGELDWGENSEPVFIETSTGNLTIWDHPEKNWENRYVIGLDTARGYDDGDYSVAVVKDVLEQKYVAMWHGKIDQTQFANVASMLGLYYNEALLAPESNLDAVVEIIKPDGLRPYIGDLYYKHERNTFRWGVFTSAGNRQKMLDFYKGWLGEGNYNKIPSLLSIEQHINFIRNKKISTVKYEAADGHHDDIVMAMTITHEAERFLYENLGDPKKYNPKNIIQIVSKPFKRNIKKIKQSNLGKN